MIVYVRHWRWVWTPWFQVFSGRRDERFSVWIETRNNVISLELWRE